MTQEIEFVKLQKDIEYLNKAANKFERQIDFNTKLTAELEGNYITLEKRLVSHSERHESNYKDLNGKFDLLTNNLATFQTNISKDLNNMKGRDSVLKVLFGVILTSAVYAITKLILV